MTMRIMLDSNVFDKVAAKPEIIHDLGLLTRTGELEIVSTHIQDDQLKKIPDRTKRDAVLGIPGRIVPTTEFVLDVSDLELSCLGNGEAGSLHYEDIRRGNPRHIEDALIALAAAHEADVLVTDDKRLGKKVKATASALQVWVSADLVAYIEDLKGRLGSD